MTGNEQALSSQTGDLSQAVQPEPTRRFLGWRMVALAFLAQNCALGMSYGSFGPLLVSTEQHFGVSRALASGAVAVALLLFAIGSPGVGILIQRTSVRLTLMIGTIVTAISYVGIGLAPSYSVALVFYGLLGLGMTLFGIIGPVTLVNRWFVRNRAKAMGIVTLPIFLFVFPALIGEFLPVIGRSGIYFALAAISIALLPVMAMVIDDPASAGQRPFGEKAEDTAASGGSPTFSSTRQILSHPFFWIITLSIGCLSAAGVAFTVHLIPLGMEKGVSPVLASALLSTFAASGILGNICLSWAADRFGPLRVLIGTALCQAALTVTLMLLSDGTSLLIVAGLLGIGVVPVVMLHSTTFGTYFGPVDVSRAMGLSYLIKTPLTLGAAPTVGYLFDRSGGYWLPFLCVAGMLTFAGVMITIGAQLRMDGRVVR